VRPPTIQANYIKHRVVLGREGWLNIPNVSFCDEPAIIMEDDCGIGRTVRDLAKNQSSTWIGQIPSSEDELDNRFLLVALESREPPNNFSYR
jgi:hypothetical protein